MTLEWIYGEKIAEKARQARSRLISIGWGRRLQIATCLTISLIVIIQMGRNLTAMLTFLPARDFVIFVELFSLIFGLYLISAYLAYEGVSKVFRGFIFALTFLFFSFLSFFNLYWTPMCIAALASVVSAFKEEGSTSIWGTMIAYFTVVLFLLPFLTSLAFVPFPVDVGTTQSDFRIAFKAEGIPPSRERVLGGIGRPTHYLYSENIVNENDVKILENYPARISLAIQENYLFDNSPAEKVVRRLNRAGVPTYAWLLASPENLYWANNLNYPAFSRLYEKFVEWKENLKFAGVVLDQELDVRKPEGNVILTLRHLYTSLDHEEAVENYASLIEKISRDENVLLSTGATVLVLDDLLDSDSSLQRIAGISAVPPRNWDKYTFQDYRINTHRVIRMDLGSYLVYSYGVTTKELYGRNSALALSHAGYLGYSDPSEIAQDCRVVSALGIPEAQIYSFEEVKKFFGREGLEEILSKGIEPGEHVSIRYNPLVPFWRFPTVYFDLYI